MTRRADYVAAAKGRRFHLAAFSVQAAERRGLQEGDPGCARFGLTVSRKVGKAVVRNRVKRRLREALGALATSGCADAGRPLPAELPAPTFDYVIVARTEALARPFAGLVEDLAAGITGVHQRRERQPGSSGSGAHLPSHRKRGRSPSPSETR
ncbi:MAG: ribonuclease P protein component [Alsobacter sp.]